MTKKTDESLLQQLRIDDIEIGCRKDLFGLKPVDIDALKYARQYVLPELNSAVDEFYKGQIAIEEVALIIGDSESMRRVRNAQFRYIDDLFSRIYDEDYVNDRLRIGLVHKRIGVEPKYYLSAIRSLKEILFKVIDNCIPDKDRTEDIKSALDKLLYMDTAFVFDTYIRSMLSEIEVAKESADRYSRSLEERVRERTRELEALSRRDSLTGVLNRYAFTEALRKEMARAKRSSEPLSILYLDVDNFKEINDTQGHHKGDQVLQLIARSLIESSREIDIIARLGGDEFCVVLPGADEDSANAYRTRFIRILGDCCKGVSVSIGISVSGPVEYVEPEVMITAADFRMYNEKSLHHRQ